MKVKTWIGSPDRQLRVWRPCPCGCDQRGGESLTGYLSGSDEMGRGFSLLAETETEFQTLREIAAAAGVPQEVGA